MRKPGYMFEMHNFQAQNISQIGCLWDNYTFKIALKEVREIVHRIAFALLTAGEGTLVLSVLLRWWVSENERHCNQGLRKNKKQKNIALEGWKPFSNVIGPLVDFEEQTKCLSIWPMGKWFHFGNKSQILFLNGLDMNDAFSSLSNLTDWSLPNALRI